MHRTTKSFVRRLVNRAGYELVHLQASETSYIRSLAASHAIDLVLDVGANEGQYGQHMRAIGYAGDMLSFEPGDVAYRRLVANSRHDGRWHTLKLALSDRSGEAQLHISGNLVSSSLLPMDADHIEADPRSAYVKAETVPLGRLDALDLSPYQNLWLKIDVQGTEATVLDGAAEVMHRVRVIQLELSLRELYVGQSSLLELLGSLSAKGYQLTGLEPGFRNPRTGDLLQVDGIFRQR